MGKTPRGTICCGGKGSRRELYYDVIDDVFYPYQSLDITELLFRVHGLLFYYLRHFTFTTLANINCSIKLLSKMEF